MANIGIDFGTTNSLMVAYDKKENRFIYFHYDQTLPVPISSTIWYTDNVIIVGKEARENINNLADVPGNHFEKSIKLKLGEAIGINVLGKKKQPYQIAADIIAHIKNMAIEKSEAYKRVNLNKAVFTIPINFNGTQREALRKAAHEAGIEVQTFIHEPFAAVIGYFFANIIGEKVRDNIEEIRKYNGKNILVFDWGGGTLDITVVKIENGKMIEIGTAELTAQAGDKFDEDIAKWAWEKFINKYGGEYDYTTLEKKRKDKWDKILSRAESCKISLSKSDEANLTVVNILDNKHINEKISRHVFDKLIQSSIFDSCNAIDRALYEAKISDLNIDLVLLTGGTCYIPSIQNKLREKFGHKVISVKNPELLIAQGAAVIAEMRWQPFLTKDISIELSDDSLYPLFEKGTNISVANIAKKTEDLICCDNRGGHAKIIIVEGVGQRKDKNLSLFKVPVLNHSKISSDIKLDATIDQNIILKISARSKMVLGFKQPEEDYCISKSSEIHHLCFGLNFDH